MQTVSGNPSSGRNEKIVVIENRQLIPEIDHYVRLVDWLYHGVSFSIGTTSTSNVQTLLKRGISVRVLAPAEERGNIIIFKLRNSRDAVEKISGTILYVHGDLCVVKGSQSIFTSLKVYDTSITPLPENTIHPVFQSTYRPKIISEYPDIDSLVSLVSDSSIGNYIQGLQNLRTRDYRASNKDTVFQWVRDQFLASGIEDVELDSFQYSGLWQCNVVATIPGTVHPQSELLVGGHLDCVSGVIDFAPGADDNASGTAAALEIARVLSVSGYRPSMTIRCIGFATEEAGLKGSNHYANEAWTTHHDIKAMFNYDMIGNRTAGNRDREFYIINPSQSSAFGELTKHMALRYTTLKPILHFSTGSDDASFYNQGYHTVWSVERDFSPYYHSQNDVYQNLDMVYARDIVRTGIGTLLTLDKIPPQVHHFQVRDLGTGSGLFISMGEIPIKDFYMYKISVGTTPGTFIKTYHTASPSYTVHSLINGTRYYIGVSIIDHAGQEGVITEKTGIPSILPLPPVGIGVTLVDGSVQLKWLANTEMDIAGYAVYKREEEHAGFIKMNSLPFSDTVWVDLNTISGISSYYISAVDASGNESQPSDTVTFNPNFVEYDAPYSIPDEYELYDNFPNPCNPVTTIRFALPVASFVTLKLYSTLGNEIALIASGEYSAGVHELVFDGSKYSSGVYFYRLTCSSFDQDGIVRFVKMKKILLIQ